MILDKYYLLLGHSLASCPNAQLEEHQPLHNLNTDSYFLGIVKLQKVTFNYNTLPTSMEYIPLYLGTITKDVVIVLEHSSLSAQVIVGVASSREGIEGLDD